MRYYEIARELNYSFEVLSQRSSEVGLIANSPFSVVPESILVKMRAAFPKQGENPCLVRQKPKVKRVSKPKPKPVLKPKIEKQEVVVEFEGGIEVNEESIAQGSFFEVQEDEPAIVEKIVDEPVFVEKMIPEEKIVEVVPEEVIEPVVEKVVEKPAVIVESKLVVKKKNIVPIKEPVSDKVPEDDNELLLGKIKADVDTSGDSFVVGRIVSESPNQPAKVAVPKKQRKRKNGQEKQDRQSEWSQKNGQITVSSVPRKVQNETKGSKLQRMQLVYGHEIPKKFRSRSGARTASSPDSKVITVPISIKDLSEELGVKANDVIKYLMTQGLFLTITNQVELEMAEAVAIQFNVEAEFAEASSEQDVIKKIIKQSDNNDDLDSRPPVITIMGHVDHGKTTLLDSIRESKVAAGESGGITQHIGGYQVEKNGQVMTFLDTPGHAAFTSMRSRGAQITDIIILVVAANDGMMPQTEEAINHAKAAGVPIIVAVNKMDLEDANPNKIKEQLATLDLIPEEWSGSTAYVPISALKGDGIDDLLEMINLQSEMLELKADFKCLGEGIVVESHMETGRGVVANVLVRQGYLKKGAPVLCGKGFGFLRMMEDENGKQVKEAGPSRIVKLMGLSTCPSPGELFNIMPNIKKAKEMAAEREAKDRDERLKEKDALTMDSLMSQLTEQEVKNINIVLKGDVQGSVEALRQALSELGNEEVKAKIIHSGIGAVTESDILLAKTSGSVVFAFNVNADGKARRLAADENVEIRKYNIIYEILEYVQSHLEGMLEPDKVEEVVGEIEVREVFKISNIGNISGSYVTSGYVERNMPARLVRDGIVVYTGKILALRRFKDDVKRVEQRYECGVRLDNYEDIRAEDTIEVYTVTEIQKKL